YNLDTLISYREHKFQTTKQTDMEYKRAIGHVHAYKQLLSLIEKKGNKKIESLVVEQFWTTLITAGWITGENRQLNLSLKYYITALLLKPLKLNPLKGIVSSLYKIIKN
ncbi:MAG: hypothetical protein GQ532_01140, partial [Methylomarinum sp.]|nr:hypothetical protein [Methylomarinum sp.]